MSIILLWRFCDRWRTNLFHFLQCLARLRQIGIVDQQQQLRKLVEQVADTLATMMNIWQVESSLEVKAHIAYWYHVVDSYRGFLLCADRCERTFLVDRETWGYVTIAKTTLLQIDGLEQAKVFIDALYRARKEEQ